jgi:hypothetical protein
MTPAELTFLKEDELLSNYKIKVYTNPWHGYMLLSIHWDRNALSSGIRPPAKRVAKMQSDPSKQNMASTIGPKPRTHMFGGVVRVQKCPTRYDNSRCHESVSHNMAIRLQTEALFKVLKRVKRTCLGHFQTGMAQLQSDIADFCC